jgi:hypothetical protein
MYKDPAGRSRGGTGGGDSGGVKNCWKAGSFSVPNVRDFMLGPDKLTSVFTLKNTVLNSKGGTVAAVGLHGSGGVGKTTACKIIANDEDVRLRYPDAVLWIQLGDDASAATVVNQIVAIVEATGGRSFADDIRTYGEKNLDKVKRKAREWFQGKSILLVVDNVFKCDNDSVPDGNWINVLRDIPSARSCILFSTRSRRIAVESDETPVKFEPLQSLEDQRTMFLKHLGIDRADPKFNPGMCDNILTLCGGVPLALATAAAVVKRMRSLNAKPTGNLCAVSCATA